MHSGIRIDGRSLFQQFKDALEGLEKVTLIDSEYDFDTTTFDIGEFVINDDLCGLDRAEKELKSIRKRLKRCGYIEAKQLREREIEVRKEIKWLKRQ